MSNLRITLAPGDRIRVNGVDVPSPVPEEGFPVGECRVMRQPRRLFRVEIFGWADHIEFAKRGRSFRTIAAPGRQRPVC